MGEGDEATVELFVTREQFSKAIEPTVTNLDDPSASLPAGMAPLGLRFRGAIHDMRNGVMRLDDLQRRLPSGRTRPVPIARVLRKHRLFPIQGIGHVPRWHCRIVPWAAPSTGSPFAAQTSRPQTPAAPAPGLRTYPCVAGRTRTGISGPTRSQHPSVTSQESTRRLVFATSASHPAPQSAAQMGSVLFTDRY